MYEQNNVLSKKIDQPAPPIGINTNSSGAPSTTGTVMMMRNAKYKTASPVIKISKSIIKNIWDQTADMGYEKLNVFNTVNLEVLTLAPVRSDTNSGPVSGDKILTVYSMGQITGPYGTADNTYATADANPEAPGFTGTISTEMDWRADCDPAFQFIARSSPRSFGYTYGYLTGDAQAPNGFPTGAGISFPQNPQVGDYFLRIDYFPQLLFRWDGKLWVRISQDVRTPTGFTAANKSQLSSFINDRAETKLTDGTFVPQRQALSTILGLTPDTLPPVT